MGLPCRLLLWIYALLLCYPPLPIVYIGEERALIFLIIIVIYLCTCLGNIRVHEETLGEVFCQEQDIRINEETL